MGDMGKFIADTMKIYANDTSSDIRMSAHFPKKHHGMPRHGQFNIIDNNKGEKGECVSKFRIYE